MTLAACSGDEAPQGEASGARIAVGSTNFSEQLLLANIYAGALRAQGVEVTTRLNLGSREVVMPALESGEIDIVPEYTGALLSYLGVEDVGSGAEEIAEALAGALPEGIAMLAPSPAQDANALAVTAETAREHGLSRISDLAPIAAQLVVGGPPEMRTRQAGLPGYQRVYGIEFGEFRPLDAGGPLTRAALNAGDIDVARVFSSQGILAAEDWVLLEDDRQLEPAQNIVPVVREAVLTPEVAEVLDVVSARLTTEDLQRLNQRVDLDHEDPAAVAQSWLDEHLAAD